MFGWKDRLLTAAKIAVGTQFPVLSFFFEDIDVLLKGFITISLDDLVVQLSDKVDEVILRIAHDERMTFIGGSLDAQSSNVIQDDVFVLHLKLYFQNRNQEFILKETSKIMPLSKLDAYSRDRLSSEGIVSYKIDTPS